MLDFDDLEKQEKSTGVGTLSRSASGASLTGEKLGGNGLSRSGSASSLTSPVPKVPDGPGASKGGGLRHGQYQRQNQDSAKPLLKKDLDAAIQGVREEMKLLLAQQQLSLQQELRSGIEPVSQELERVAVRAAPQQGASPLADQVAALQEKLARTSNGLSLLTERLDQKHKAIEDRIEDEMTEVTKGMTQLSEESHKPLDLAQEALSGLESLQQEFRTWKAHADEVASWDLQDRVEDKFKGVKDDIARLSELCAKTASQAGDADPAFAGLRNEVQALRQHMDESTAQAQRDLQELAEQRSALQREVEGTAEASEEAKRLAAATNLHARSQISALHEGLAGTNEQLAQLAEHLRAGRREQPGGRAMDRAVTAAAASGSDAENSRQILTLQDRFEGEMKEVRKSLSRVKKHVKKTPEAEDVYREQETMQEELRELKHHTDELSMRTRRMQQDLADSTGSIREELRRLADCLGKERDAPADLEGLRRDVAALQERSLARSLEGTMTPSEASVMESGAAEQEDVARAMAAVRKELLRAKDLFQSGQKSAGVVLSDVEILKQDLQRLKESRPALGESCLEQLRIGLRQELADEFRSLAAALIPRTGPS